MASYSSLMSTMIRVITSESPSIGNETAMAWVMASLEPLVQKYEEKDVFMADETALSSLPRVVAEDCL